MRALFDLRLARGPIRRHRALLLGGALLAVLTALAGLALSGAAAWYLAAAGLGGIGAAAALPALLLRLAALLRPVSRYGERLVSHEGMFRALADLRVALFARLLRLPPVEAMRLGSGDVLSRLTADVEALDGLYLRLAVPLLVAATAGSATVALLLALEPLLGLAAAAFLALCGGVLPWLAAARAAAAGRDLPAQAGALRQDCVGFAQGLTELVLSGAATSAAERLGARAAALSAAQARLSQLQAMGTAAVLALSGLLVAGALALLTHVGAGGIGAVLGVFLLLALAELTAPLPLAWQHLHRIAAAAARLNAPDRAADAASDPADPLPLPAGHRLDLRAVTAAWPDRPETLLRIDALELPQGARIGVLGASGAGKSTLLALLRRRLAPLSGEILLGGVPLAALAEADLAQVMATMTQRAELFHTTLRDNLLLADPRADDARLTAALAAAGLAPLLARLPDGLDSAVGEHGLTLSGGEARRVALARLHLRPQARILLLDEPTEGLDAATERDVLQRLLALSQGRTLIVASHRAPVLDAMDVLLRVGDGHAALQPGRA